MEGISGGNWWKFLEDYEGFEEAFRFGLTEPGNGVDDLPFGIPCAH